MKILVTGGAGFIGSHTVDALVKAEHVVDVFDNLSTGKLENINKAVRPFFTKCNAGTPTTRKYDAIFHFAAQTSVTKSMSDPLADLQNNYNELLEVAYGMNPSALLIFASSAGAAVAKPASFYGIHKLAAEHALRVVAENGGPRTVTLRYANVWGSRQRADLEGGVVAKFSDLIRRGEPIKIHGDGTQTRDMIHVNRVVEANLGALRWLQRNPTKHYESFEVGSAAETSVNDIALTIAKLLSKVHHHPRVHVEPPPGMLKRSYVTFQQRCRTERELGIKLADDFSESASLLGGVCRE